VKHPDGSLYKFSKYSMFAFDVEKIMYISGSIKYNTNPTPTHIILYYIGKNLKNKVFIPLSFPF